MYTILLCCLTFSFTLLMISFTTIPTPAFAQNSTKAMATLLMDDAIQAFNNKDLNADNRASKTN